MVQILDKLSLSCSARNRWISCCLQKQLRLRTRMLVAHIVQALQEAHVAWQGALTDTTQHAHVWLERGAETLCPILLHLAAGVFLTECA
jgi:hypothetical protein